MEQFSVIPERQQADTAILPDNSQLVESIFRAGAQRFAQNEYKYQQHKQELADKLSKITLDTSTAWEQDKPELFEKTNSFTDYVSQNPQAVEPTDLKDPEQMKLWNGYQKQKQDILQDATTSNAQKEFYYQQKKLIQDKPELYDTKENRDALEAYKNAKINDRKPFDLKQKISFNPLTYSNDIATKAGLNVPTTIDSTSGMKTKTTATDITKLGTTYAALINANDTETINGIKTGTAAINAAKSDPSQDKDMYVYDLSNIQSAVDPNKPSVTNLVPSGIKKLSQMTPNEWLVSNTLPIIWQNHYETDYVPPPKGVTVNTGDLTDKEQSVKTILDNVHQIFLNGSLKDPSGYRADLNAYKVNTVIPNIDKITWTVNGKTYKGSSIYVRNDETNPNNSRVIVVDDTGKYHKKYDAQNFAQNMLTASNANVSSATQLFLDANGDQNATFDLVKWGQKYGLPMQYLSGGTQNNGTGISGAMSNVMPQKVVVNDYSTGTSGGTKTYKGLDKDGNPIYE